MAVTRLVKARIYKRVLITGDECYNISESSDLPIIVYYKSYSRATILHRGPTVHIVTLQEQNMQYNLQFY